MITPLDLLPPDTGSALSPRLAWLRAHDVSTYFTKEFADHGDGPTESPETGEELYPWAAWVGELSAAIEGKNLDDNQPGYYTGPTEHEAIVALALARGWPLWNEQEGATT